MEKKIKKILVSDFLSKKIVDIFKSKNIEVDYLPTLGSDHKNLLKCIDQYDGIVVRSTTKITKELLKFGKKLKVVGRAGVGVDNIDLRACTKNGVVVMNTPDGNSITTAEHTIALLLSLSRKIPLANITTKQGKWQKSRFLGEEVRGKVLGIIGMGNIGSIVADLGLGLKMKILAYDPFISKHKSEVDGAVKQVENLDDLLSNSDYITLHVPLTEKTKKIISEERILKIKRGAKLINCSRGSLVDEIALCNALESGKLSGAAFDVFDNEPALKNPLFEREDTICTPHLGASTMEAQDNVAVQISEQISNFLINGAIYNSLNAPSLSAQEAPLLRPWIKTSEVIGAFIGQTVEGALNSIEIEFVGKVGDLNNKPILSTLISALLKPIVGDSRVNMISALSLAKERGINIIQIKKDAQGAFGSYIRIVVYSDNKKTSVAGTVYSDGKPRFIQIDGINLEAEPQSHMIYTTNKDIPGFIGDLGTKLGNLKINIASFALGRTKKQGKAIALLAVDDKLKKVELDAILKLPQIINAYALEF